MKYKTLQKYTDALVSKGDLVFFKNDALSALGISDAALRNSIKRQVSSKKVIRLMRGCYLIVPLEFRQLGFVPPELFVDDLMQILKIEYYICLLSAAAYYGATHQASQNFQIMVKKSINPIKIGGGQITFHVNTNFDEIPLQNIKTDRGVLRTSTPEATCLDLLSYFHQSGNLNHIITVLSEISENINSKKLCELAYEYPLISVQRFGYMMDKLKIIHISDALLKYINIRKPKLYSPLIPGKFSDIGEKNRKWHLIINEEIESDI